MATIFSQVEEVRLMVAGSDKLIAHSSGNRLQNSLHANVGRAAPPEFERSSCPRGSDPVV
jgi:hypothetical protein